MSDESFQASSEPDVPESEGLVPGAGDDVAVVVGDGEVADEVVVTGEALEWDSELGLVFIWGQLPDHEGLVS